MGIKSTATKLTFVLVVLTSFVKAASACSAGPRVDGVYKDYEFAFLGTVIGYLSPVSAIKPFTRWKIDESKRP